MEFPGSIKGSLLATNMLDIPLHEYKTNNKSWRQPTNDESKTITSVESRKQTKQSNLTEDFKINTTVIHQGRPKHTSANTVDNRNRPPLIYADKTYL